MASRGTGGSSVVFMPSPILVSLLDPRPASQAEQEPIEDSVNIPLDELEGRMHELPPRHGKLQVAGPEPWAAKACEFLRKSGRNADMSTDWDYEMVSSRSSENLQLSGPQSEVQNPKSKIERGRLWKPNPYLEEIVASLPPGRALDLACGSGRDAVFLAGIGWEVTAIDHLPDALERGRDLVARYLNPSDAARIEWVVRDLEEGPTALDNGYDLVSVFWYLNRDMIRGAHQLLRRGGSLVVETFTTVHRERFGKPRTEAFVLQPAELRDLVQPLKIRFYEEAWHEDRHSARVWATN